MQTKLNTSPTGALHEAVRQFFATYGNYQQVDHELWKILVASFNSNDIKGDDPLSLANKLCLYKDLTTLLQQLDPKQHATVQ